jgi:hypothetical protein
MPRLTPHPVILILALALLGASQEAQQTSYRIKDSDLEIPLPPGFADVGNAPLQVRILKRSLGREPWAKVTIEFYRAETLLPQPLGDPDASDLLTLLPYLKDAKTSFQKQSWRDFSLGVIEFRRVDDSIPVVGYATILPLTPRGVILLCYAADPLEKDAKQDFLTIIGAARGATNWISPEVQLKMQRATRIFQAGLGSIGLYMACWFLFFRGQFMKAHLFRTVWLLGTAVVLFLPVSIHPDPGWAMLVLCYVLPAMLFGFAGRRIKLAIDEGD